MTLTDLMRALWRRWYVVLFGIAVSLGLAFLATRAEPVYHGRTEVVLLAPASTRYPNELVTSSESLILTAGIISKRINGAEERLKFGSSQVNPVGVPDTGEHTWIQLLDTGNQWVPIFDEQLLLVDAIGSTPEQAKERIDAAAALIRSELVALEREQGVDPLNDIGLRMSPEAPRITKIDGSGARAAGMTLVLGVLGTIALVVGLEVRTSMRIDPTQHPGLRARRRRHRRGQAAARL